MSETKVSVRARVKVTLMIEVGDRWGGDCPMEQVQRQAASSALGTVLQMVQGGIDMKPISGVSVVGEPLVDMVLTEERRP